MPFKGSKACERPSARFGACSFGLSIEDIGDDGRDDRPDDRRDDRPDDVHKHTDDRGDHRVDLDLSGICPYI